VISDLRLGYPFRTMAVLAAVLALAVLFLVLPVGRRPAWTVAAVVVALAFALVVLRTRQLGRAREQSAHVLAALGATTADLPVSLRTRMPLVLVTGDALAQLFNRNGGNDDEERLAHVGDGAIWLRADRPQDLPRLAVAVRQWRDGRAPDGVVLSIAPALHAGEDALTQALRIVRQAVSDTSRMLGARLPGYVAVYQRLTNVPTAEGARQWYGVSSAMRLRGAQRFEGVIRAAETEARRAVGDATFAARAAGLASVIGWTQRVVIGTLTDRPQPAAPWRLFGAGWIDCGPASGPHTPWARDVEAHTRIVPPAMAASPAPWPLPQPLIQALPRRLWVSPRTAAVAHAIALVACAGALAIWGSAKNNQALLTHIGTDLGRFSKIPADHDTARRDALQALVSDRDQLDRYGRTGVPLRLSFGMYRAATLMPVLNEAIASYQAPPPPPAVVTLDSMSLFDSGRAQLKPGSTRAMVGALELIKAHPDKRILVAGYTDNVGNPESNLKLSIARAGAVRDWLIEASGMSATRFAIQGSGDTRPIADNETAAGRAKNRRVEITLVPDTPGN
jgi:outer membrane protein OmpA-like peptidoglycan-associated protein